MATYSGAMTTIQGIFRGIHNVFLLNRQALTYIGTFIWALVTPRTILAARLLASESQLAMQKLRIQQKKDPRPRFTPAFRLLWVTLSNCWDGWKEHAHLMQPATVKKWHTRAFRIYWR
jgi:hypothetical protein